MVLTLFEDYDYKLYVSYSQIYIARISKEGVHRGMYNILRYPQLFGKVVVQGLGYSIGLAPLILLASWVF